MKGLELELWEPGPKVWTLLTRPHWFAEHPWLPSSLSWPPRQITVSAPRRRGGLCLFALSMISSCKNLILHREGHSLRNCSMWIHTSQGGGQQYQHYLLQTEIFLFLTKLLWLWAESKSLSAKVPRETNSHYEVFLTNVLEIVKGQLSKYAKNLQAASLDNELALHPIALFLGFQFSSESQQCPFISYAMILTFFFFWDWWSKWFYRSLILKYMQFYCNFGML